MKLIFVNPINNEEDFINICYPRNDYGKWREYNQLGQYDIVLNMIDYYLSKLDCCIIYKSGRPMATSFPIYNNYLSDAYYWISKLQDQFIYNNIIDKIIKIHCDNIIYEYKHPITKDIIVNRKKDKKVSIKSKTPWVRQETIDLFTGNTTYIYQNVNTGKIVKDNNPNKAEELNSKRNKEKHGKSITMDAMTFTFKTKKDDI